jgi:hypothetical protein
VVVTILAMRAGLFGAIYLVLVGQLSADEIGLAIALAAVVLGWSVALDRVAPLRFRFSLAAMAIVGRAVIKVPQAITEVAPALLWRRRGSVCHEPLAQGRSSADAGGRAAALIAISLAPDRYALRWTKGDAVEIHRLSIAPASE